MQSKFEGKAKLGNIVAYCLHFSVRSGFMVVECG